ncbi:hypothetical protein ACFXJ8_00820 [Nonomuraea sp. NPDC059194]|uniref:hypothetical protein n=1 Tax=Nonomuraea sp. NPDC059194 TaxID=3346764 RepID=UPI0036B5F722
MAVEDKWPGLDPKPGEIDLKSKDQLVGILKDLAYGLERLEGMEIGSQPDLYRRAKLMKPVIMGDWPAGDDFFEATDQAHLYVNGIYERINYKYRAALEKIINGEGLLMSIDDANKGGTAI